MSGSYGLKVAKQGKDVTLASDTDLVFKFPFNTLPVFNVISLEYSLAAAADQTKIIKHGLTFVPFTMLFIKKSGLADRWVTFPDNPDFMFTSGDFLQILHYRVDKENISIRISNGNGSTNIIGLKIVVFAFPVALAI